MTKKIAGRFLPGTLVCSLLLISNAGGEPFPAEVELSTLLPVNGGDGSAGIILNGAEVSSRSGMAIANAGDINADGIDDVVIGAFQASPGGMPSAGEAYIVFGTATPGPQLDLANLFAANGGDGSAGFVVTGILAGDFSGENVSGGGDINNDGIDDVIIGAAFADVGMTTEAGRGIVIYGSDTGFPAQIAASTLLSANGGDGSVGTIINGIATADFAGRVALGGDFNADGIDDVMIGAERADPGGRSRAGKVFVVFGNGAGLGAEFDLATLQVAGGGDGSSGVVLNGINAGDDAGTDVVSAADANGDGIDDMLIGAPRSNGSAGQTLSGEAYLVFGRSSWPAEMELSTLLPGNGGDGSDGVILYGSNFGTFTGTGIGAVDINGDLLADLIVGAPTANRTYIYFGRPSFGATVVLDSLTSGAGGDGSNGFVLSGTAPGESLGRAVSGLGDINGDGFNDLLSSAYLSAPGGRDNAGSAFAVYGKAGGFPAELDVTTLRAANGGDGSLGFVINGIDAFDGAGIDVSAAGDFNNDGVADLVISADTADPNGLDSAGETYVLFGRVGDTPDNDGDGIPDGSDNCPAVANPDQADGDADGFGDVCDNCATTFNDDQADGDADGFGDVCDNCATTFNDDQADGDADGFGDVCDNCATTFNDDQADGDADGFGDVCDNCATTFNDDQADGDADGFGDVCDNCATTFNDDQADGDADGFGDVCDNCAATFNDDQADGDADGFGDVCDNCTEVFNPMQTDTNGDGYGNYCDADVNNDNIVNFMDLDALKAVFFSNTTSPNWDPDLDFNSDGNVNFMDLDVMKGSFFGPPGPSGLVP